jgi:hypothetical protein
MDTGCLLEGVGRDTSSGAQLVSQKEAREGVVSEGSEYNFQGGHWTGMCITSLNL